MCVGCEPCFVVVHVRLFSVWFEQTDVVSDEIPSRDCHVRLELSGCIPFRPVLRDAVSVVQF